MIAEYEHPIGVIFTTSEHGRKIVGQLKLTNGDLFTSNVVNIVDDEFFFLDEDDHMHGVSSAGKVSLIECLRSDPLGQTSWGDFSVHHGNVPFRYAVFGTRHITATEECIHGIQFSLEGVESSVFADDFRKTFGHIRYPDVKIIEAIEKYQPDYLSGRSFGDGAMVSYFTGNWDFLSRLDTAIGTIHIARTVYEGTFRSNMDNTATIAVDFDDSPTTLSNAWEKMRIVRQFFAWMIGYVSEWKDVVVHTSPLDDYRRRTDGQLTVFAVKEGPSSEGSARRRDSLIDASRSPEHFADVMRSWLDRNVNGGMDRANEQFFSSIAANRYLEDSIVSAANTFDLLPESEKPKPEELSQADLDVLENVRREIKNNMGNIPERDSILRAIGYAVSSKSLRAIIASRADVVLQHSAKGELDGLADVVRLAVKCRNYYTHGPSGKEEDKHFADFAVVRFLTATLEFIYGASELLLCGWDRSKVIGNLHPLIAYIRDYDYNRKVALKHLLKTSEV